MQSDIALVQASAGLQMMMSTKPSGIIEESLTAQVSAAIFYQAQVMSKITKNKTFQGKFRKIIFSQIERDFGNYIDAKARVNAKSLHHVYEWNKVGDQESRLFKLNPISTGPTSFSLSYEFLPSKSFTKSGKRRHVFVEKASVMEAGRPVKISPKFSERIVFDINGYTVFMPKGESVIVSKPGGNAVKKSFQSAFRFFFSSSLVNLSIKKSGFEKLFNSSITKALKLPYEIRKVKYSYSPGSLSAQADFALTTAFGARS